MSSNGSVEDRLAIRETLDRFCDGVNQQDAEIWGSTWAEDSEWNLPVMPGYEEVKGKAAIVEAWVKSMEHFSRVHMMTQVGTLRFEGNTCYMRSYNTETAVLKDGTELHPRGQYDDILVKQDGAWLFAKRSFVPHNS